MIVFPFGSMDAGRWLPVDPASGAASVRRMAEDLARTVGLAERRVAQLSIVASEMAGNIAKHAERGAVMVRAVRAGGDAGVELVAVDHLPGIADLALSLQDGYSTTGTLGIGLGAITRQAGWYDIQSTPGRGTIVAAQVWPDRTPDAAWVSGVSRPMPDEVICGDRMAVRDIDGHRQILLCDGAGHGALAAVTADAAVRAFGEVPEVAPDRVVAALHDRLLASVGAAVAVADFSPDLSEVRYAAVGDVEACLSHPDGSRQILTPQRGIVGRAGDPIRQRTYPLTPGAVMVVHSDGVSSRRWQAHEYPDLLHRSPQVIAAALLCDAGTRRDDASVLVVKVPLAHAPGSSRPTPA